MKQPIGAYNSDCPQGFDFVREAIVKYFYIFKRFI